MPFTIIYQPSAESALRKLPRETQVRITRKIATLANDPHPPGSEKLSAPVDLWRIRVGDYRVIYTIRAKQLLVLVLKIGHRRDVYR